MLVQVARLRNSKESVAVQKGSLMATPLNKHPASGGPGIEPRWTRSDKDGVGTAYSDLSRVWFTVSKGILNEVYYPTVDRPQIRDLQYLITDGETFFRDERHLDNTHECLAPDARARLRRGAQGARFRTRRRQSGIRAAEAPGGRRRRGRALPAGDRRLR